MSPRLILGLIRGLHTTIYLVMATACFVVLFAAVTGRQGLWLSIALWLVAVETVIFIAAGLRCPLTALAVKYGASRAQPADTYLPETMTRHTLAVFGPMVALSAALLLARRLFG